MRLKLCEMDEIENDPSKNSIISPEEAEADAVEEVIVLESDEHALRLVDVVPDLPDEEGDEDAFLDVDEFVNGGEISALSRQLDQLQSALDEIESRNENIHKELLEILYSNREVRKDLSAEKQSVVSGGGGTATVAIPTSAGTPLDVTGISGEGGDAVNQSNDLSNDAMALLKLVKTVTDKIDKL